MKKQSRREQQIEESGVLAKKHPAELTEKEKRALESLRAKYEN